MAIRENFISDAPDEESGAKVNLIDNNKTLYIDQFTSDVQSENWSFEQDICSVDDAFKCFQPTVDVDFKDNDGSIVSETLTFNEIKDFEAQGGKGRLVSNSKYLSGVKKELDANTKMLKTIKQNRKLTEVLKDADSREELKAVLKSMLAELEN